MPSQTPQFWKSKLAAFLHDPPHKQFSLQFHEDARGPLLRQIGLTEQDMFDWAKQSDWIASAADRYSFPSASKLCVDWKNDGNLQFHHPLAGTRFTPSLQPRKNSSTGETWAEDALSGLNLENADERARFFRIWRFWAERAAREKNELMAYLPADSRIPDHTIWQHNALCSALDSAGAKPAFLMMQIGPVQEFIAQSRKMQDLWSGSYLLSYLISQALAAIAFEIGPESIIFPSLRGVPLLDWAWSCEQGLFPPDTFSHGKGRLHSSELLIPSLPNRFLALIPAGSEGRRIAALAKKAIEDEWQKIADSVHEDICSKLSPEIQQRFQDWDNVWQSQVRRFPVVDFVIHEWQPDPVKLATENTPPLTGGWGNHPLNHAEQWRKIVEAMGESRHVGTNLGSHWALHYATTDWKFSAAKNARDFAGWQTPAGTDGNPIGSAKDHLNGRDEVIGGAQNDAFWEALRTVYNGEERGDFKGQQRYGAVTVIKRLWARTYLGGKLKWAPYRPNLESVQDVANTESDPEKLTEWKRQRWLKQTEACLDAEQDTDKYYAVLCMDGDDMGQWVSGHKAPPITQALAEKAKAFFLQHWRGDAAANDVKRPLSPSYHAALSESLNHFSLYAAGQIVEKFSGQLFYAGGDDVLAILPAQYALDCATALKCAFQGQVPEDLPEAVKKPLRDLFELKDGFLRCLVHSSRSENHRPNWPLLVPGPEATVSVGIAVGHVRSPMQDVIKAAREAESAAKKVPNKGAYCLRVLKRSGESAEFSARFESGVLAVWDELSADVHGFSNRFPYRYAQLLKPLLSSSGSSSDEGWIKVWSSELIEACEAELRHTLIQQSGMKSDKATPLAEIWIQKLVGTSEIPILTPKGFLHFWMAWAFINRISTEEN
jgi:CRISPR-associated protein Cmr2